MPGLGLQGGLWMEGGGTTPLVVLPVFLFGGGIDQEQLRDLLANDVAVLLSQEVGVIPFCPALDSARFLEGIDRHGVALGQELGISRGHRLGIRALLILADEAVQLLDVLEIEDVRLVDHAPFISRHHVYNRNEGLLAHSLP